MEEKKVEKKPVGRPKGSTNKPKVEKPKEAVVPKEEVKKPTPTTPKEEKPKIEKPKEEIILENTVKIEAPVESEAITKDMNKNVKEKPPIAEKDYDPNRPEVAIGVVCGMKELSYSQVDGHIQTAMWTFPPWEYKRKIYAVNFGPNYQTVKKFAVAHKLPLQTVPIYWTSGVTAKVHAFEHLVRQIRGGSLLILKDKEDGAVNKLIAMAKMYDITIYVKEY